MAIPDTIKFLHTLWTKKRQSLHVPKYLRILKNAVWFVRWTRYLSAIHDIHHLKHDRWLSWSIHGWFLSFGSSCEDCLQNIEKVLKWCTEINLALSWEKSHFMICEGIVLGRVVSERGTDVDKAKIDFIFKLLPPTSVYQISSFLSHVGFYHRFIKDCSKIYHPLCNLIGKDVPFAFDDIRLEAFQTLRDALTKAQHPTTRLVPSLRNHVWWLWFCN